MSTITADVQHKSDGSFIVTYDDEPDVRYVAMQDTDAESPVNWGWFDAYVYRTSYRGTTDEGRADERVEVRAFFEFMDRFNDEHYVLPIVKRYMRIFHDVELNDSIVTYSARGYSQSDWWDILVVTDDTSADAEGCAEVWEQWARGDVWFVYPEKRISCEHPDYCHSHDDDNHWDREAFDHQGIGGIYADDAESAVAQYGPMS